MLALLNLCLGFVLAYSLFLQCVISEQFEADARGEEALFKKLFLEDLEKAKVNRIIRPPGSESPSGPVKVDIGYTPIAITSFDEISGFITFYVWERSMWVDKRLRWKASEYQGVDTIQVPADLIWLHDLTLYSPGSKDTTDDLHEEKVLLTSSGIVLFIPKRNFRFKCNMDIEDFPYDTQICKFTHGSWLHHAGEINFTNFGTDFSNLDDSHNDWMILNYSMSSVMTEYPCCPESFQRLIFSLTIQRRPQFYFYMFIVPALVMFPILPIIHLFPPGCSQKTTTAGLLLICSLLLNLMLYQQIGGFAEEKVPKLVHHYQSLMAMILVSIGVSSLTSTLANAVNTSRRVPTVIRKVMNSVVGRICCFRAADLKGEFTQLGQTSIHIRYDPHHDMAPIVHNAADDAADEANNQTHSLSSALTQLTAELRYGRERRQLEMEWYQLALLIDRLTVLTFLLYVIVGSSVMESH